MKVFAIMVATFLAISGFAAARQDENSIRGFARVTDKFCVAGQPKTEQLATLKAIGIKTIINLRPADEFNASEEEKKAKELGIRYFNIPVMYTAPKDEQATEFLRITDDPKNQPVFIHCTAGIRAAAFWMIRRVLRDGWSLKDAQDEADKVGLRHTEHLLTFATNYIEHHRTK